MEFITAAKEIVIAVAASVGAYAAWAGVHAWKKQLRGTSEWDVGRRLMVSILELQSETLKVQSLIFWDSLTQSIYDDSYREFIRSLDDANIRGRQERLQLE